MPLSQISPTTNYTSAPLLPVFAEPQAAENAINLGPSLTLVKGTLLGNYTSSANDVQTITMAGTSGNWTITANNPFAANQPATTAAMAFNIPVSTTATNLQAILVAIFGAGNVAVTGTAGSSYVVTFGGALAKMPVAVMTVGQGTLAGGAVSIAHTTVGRSTGTYAAYVSTATDGTGTARCILKFDAATDTFGNITLGGANAGGEWGQTTPSCPAYFSGMFYTAQLTGLDANGVTNLGRLWTGTTTVGILSVIA